MSEQTSPFLVLTDIGRRSRALAAGLPAQEEVVELWNGIGFSLAGQKYVAPMGEVIEILHVPRYTQVPGVEHWLCGIANVRGRLLPILDLCYFFNLPRTTSIRDKRVLVVENGDILSGLIVDSVQGMQYFAVDSYRPQIPVQNESMAPFVKGAYVKNNEPWSVFSAVALTEDDRFLDVSA